MPAIRPSWDRLYEEANAQQGYFTLRQAATAGYSPQLIIKHIRSGRIARIRRGVYRLLHYPTTENNELMVLWLWSERAGVFSHETALSLYQLSDVLPARVHLTLPTSWQPKRLRVPDAAMLHYADLDASQSDWFGAVPITNVQRTLNDCANVLLSPDLLLQAAHQALQRGMVDARELRAVDHALAPYGGLARASSNLRNS